MRRKTQVEKLIDIALDSVDVLLLLDFDYEVRALLLCIKDDFLHLKRKVVG